MIGGADSIRNNSVWIAAAVVIAGLVVLVRLLTQYGWSDISAGQPAYASGDLHLDYTLGFEILVATVLSWWPYMGGIMRMSKSVKQALLPSMICLGMITGVIGLIGLYAGLATGDPDPSISFVKVAGLWMGIIAVVFIGLANIGTAIVGVYATGIGLKQIPALQYRLTWKWTTAVVLAPVAFIAAFVPNWFMDNSLTYMYFLGPGVRAHLRRADRRLLLLPPPADRHGLALRLLGQGPVLLLGRLQPRGASSPRRSASSSTGTCSTR